jgi:hypothetical protein
MLMDPALKVYADIVKDKDHPDAFKVATDVLERNKLFGTGTPEDAKPGHNLMVNTQVNTNVSAMSDVELATYEKLLRELREALPDAPKAIEVLAPCTLLRAGAPPRTQPARKGSQPKL